MERLWLKRKRIRVLKALFDGKEVKITSSKNYFYYRKRRKNRLQPRLFSPQKTSFRLPIPHFIFRLTKAMTPNRIIYVINQSPELLKAWRELSESQKRQVLKDCETADESEIEKIIKEIADGQRRLF